MAVQAQFPSNAGLSPDFRTSSQAPNILDGRLLHSLRRSPVLTGDAMQRPTAFTNASDLSEAPPVFLQQPVPNSSAAQSSNACECAVPSSSGQPIGVSSDLLAPFHQQNLETNALLWIQNERLRLQMMDAHRRCCNAVIAAHGEQIAKRLCEKEAELQYASLMNAELQNKLGEIRTQNWLLFKIAKNNEALVASLKKSLVEVNAQNAATAAASAVGVEGYGESEGTSAPATVVRGSIECKLCRNNDACFLVLPCRHLCLCKTCETVIGWCPICFEAKNGRVHVLFS